MRIIVLGGDGFCGWPTALHLSNRGHEVIIVDNLSRRDIDDELEVGSLTPISPIGVRLRAWKEVTGRDIEFVNMDVAKDYDRLFDLVLGSGPDAIVHLAEQRAAPYSMKDERSKRYTVDNNLRATHNVLCAIVETGLDIHLVHLGAMGAYGRGSAGVHTPEGHPGVRIPAGDTRLFHSEIPFPANPGSVYHMTKVQNRLFFNFYNKNDGVCITDLRQGVVWGTNTEETSLDERLINRFDYDGDYGTVLNRFLMQAAVGHPLTVHGAGGQTRAFIHINDTVGCIEHALTNPPLHGERVRIFNQMTETHRVRELADMVSAMTGAKIRCVPNPRLKEAEGEHIAEKGRLIDTGPETTTLDKGLMLEVFDIAKRYAHRCDRSKIQCRSIWRRGMHYPEPADDHRREAIFPRPGDGAGQAVIGC